MQFSKLQGAGNDYVFVDGRGSERNWVELAVRISDRHFGVGADGLIVADSSDQAAIRMRMFNADGSEGEMCGNGIRCFAKYVLEREIIPARPRSLDVETGAGVLAIVPRWQGGRVVGARVDMGSPILCSADVPVVPSRVGPSDYAELDMDIVSEMGLSAADLVFDAPVTVDGATFALTAVSMGNPHVAAFIDESVNETPLDRIGPLMERNEAFPARVNFHIVNIVDRGHIVTRTWERGSGLTLACGTGASAVVVAARLHGYVDDAVRVEVPGGELGIVWTGAGSVYMDGDAVEVFSGEWPE